MAQLFANNAYASLASPASAVDTLLTLASGTGARFPSPTGGDYFLATLVGIDGNGAENAWEIVKVTARASDVLTVVRAQESTTAAIWTAGTRIEQRATKGTFDLLVPTTAIGASVQAYDADLVAIAGLSSNGLVARTGSGLAQVRSITQPAAGITVTNGDGVSGNPTLALANDLSAVEAISTTGFVRRTASETWSASAIVDGDLPSALTGKTYNALTLTNNATGFSVAGGTTAKTLTVSNSITLDGTDGTTITLPASTGTVPLNNQTFFIGTTSVAINRASASLSLTGVNIDGSANTAASATSATTSTNLAAGVLGSVPYQSAAATTALLAPNTTATRNFMRMTGTGTVGAAPAWDTLVNSDIPSALTGKTYNALTLTAAATGFTIAGGTTSKTLTVGNTLTLSGTDASTLNIGAGGTLGTGAYATIADYALLAGPTFTGTPAAPTAAVDTNTTQLATTAYVVGQGYLKSATASSTYQTQAGMSSYLTTATASSTYAPLASPNFTGSTKTPYAIFTDGITAYNSATGGVYIGYSSGGVIRSVSDNAGAAVKLGFQTDNSGVDRVVIDTVGNLTMTTGSIREFRTALGANDINLSAGNYFTKTISGATTLTVSNVPTTGTAASFILDLTNGGSSAITWWTVKWAGGTAPTLTAAGRDCLGFFTHDGGTTWTGLVLGKDVK